MIRRGEEPVNLRVAGVARCTCLLSAGDLCVPLVFVSHLAVTDFGLGGKYEMAFVCFGNCNYFVRR